MGESFVGSQVECGIRLVYADLLISSPSTKIPVECTAAEKVHRSIKSPQSKLMSLLPLGRGYQQCGDRIIWEINATSKLRVGWLA